MTERGRSIVVEGNDGTGKSTQVELLGQRLKDEYAIDSLILHEPDGPGISAAIRTIIKNGSLERDAITNLLLFTASRHESNRIGEDALARGIWLLKARDWSSSEAYQGSGEGLDAEYIRTITTEFTSPLYMAPDLKVILALQDHERSERIAGRGELENPDTFEMRDDGFQQRVNHAYLTIAEREQYPVIDAARTISEIHEDIMELLWVRNLIPRKR